MPRHEADHSLRSSVQGAGRIIKRPYSGGSHCPLVLDTKTSRDVFIRVLAIPEVTMRATGSTSTITTRSVTQDLAGRTTQRLSFEIRIKTVTGSG